VTVLRSGSATDVGRVRKVNQDLPLEAPNLYAVADGMGGHVGGEVAAQVAVDALLRGFSREPTKIGLRDAFALANSAVWQESQENSELRGMGTTLTALALVGGEDGRDMLALANVGDSRAYLFSEDQIVQITADHSLAEERMRHGEMTEAEAAVHPQRHILTRALGVASHVEADMWELRLRTGDRLVLCSDGLSNEITREELAGVLATVPEPDEAAHHLVEIANDHGGSDNITVVVVDVLVGEDTPEQASVITPIGARAGAPLVLGPAVGLGPAGGMRPADIFAEGSQLGFGGRATSVGRTAPRTGVFAPGGTQVIPVARATDRTAPPVVPRFEAPPPDESRRARRRRLGIPRRVTVRVVLFVLLVAAVPTAAFYAIRWYAYDNWYLSVRQDVIIVEQGHPGGVLWFQPKEADDSGITTSQLLPADVAEIRSGVQEPSLLAAERYINNLRSEYISAQEAENAKAAPGAATAPGGAATAPGGAPTTPGTTITGAGTTTGPATTTATTVPTVPTVPTAPTGTTAP